MAFKKLIKTRSKSSIVEKSSFENLDMKISGLSSKSYRVKSAANLPRLHRAIWQEEFALVSNLIKKSDVNSCDKELRTPLHFACFKGNEQILKLLLHYKPNIDQQDLEKKTPLYKAVEIGSVACVTALLEEGSNPNIFSNDSYSPLHITSLRNDVEVAGLLINKGANANFTNGPKGSTALHLAAKLGHDAYVNFITNHVSDLDCFDSENKSPLMLACENGRIQVVKLLLDKGSNSTLKNDIGWTARNYAVTNGHNDCARLIEENIKVTATIKDSDNKHLFFIADSEHNRDSKLKATASDADFLMKSPTSEDRVSVKELNSSSDDNSVSSEYSEYNSKLNKISLSSVLMQEGTITLDRNNGNDTLDPRPYNDTTHSESVLQKSSEYKDQTDINECEIPTQLNCAELASNANININSSFQNTINDGNLKYTPISEAKSLQDNINEDTTHFDDETNPDYMNKDGSRVVQLNEILHDNLTIEHTDSNDLLQSKDYISVQDSMLNNYNQNQQNISAQFDHDNPDLFNINNKVDDVSLTYNQSNDRDVLNHEMTNQNVSIISDNAPNIKQNIIKGTETNNSLLNRNQFSDFDSETDSDIVQHNDTLQSNQPSSQTNIYNVIDNSDSSPSESDTNGIVDQINGSNRANITQSDEVNLEISNKSFNNITNSLENNFNEPEIPNYQCLSSQAPASHVTEADSKLDEIQDISNSKITICSESISNADTNKCLISPLIETLEACAFNKQPIPTDTLKTNYFEFNSNLDEADVQQPLLIHTNSNNINDDVKFSYTQVITNNTCMLNSPGQLKENSMLIQESSDTSSCDESIASQAIEIDNKLSENIPILPTSLVHPSTQFQLDSLMNDPSRQLQDNLSDQNIFPTIGINDQNSHSKLGFQESINYEIIIKLKEELWKLREAKEILEKKLHEIQLQFSEGEEEFKCLNLKYELLAKENLFLKSENDEKLLRFRQKFEEISDIPSESDKLIPTLHEKIIKLENQLMLLTESHSKDEIIHTKSKLELDMYEFKNQKLSELLYNLNTQIDNDKIENGLIKNEILDLKEKYLDEKEKNAALTLCKQNDSNEIQNLQTLKDINFRQSEENLNDIHNIKLELRDKDRKVEELMNQLHIKGEESTGELLAKQDKFISTEKQLEAHIKQLEITTIHLKSDKERIQFELEFSKSNLLKLESEFKTMNSNLTMANAEVSKLNQIVEEKEQILIERLHDLQTYKLLTEKEFFSLNNQFEQKSKDLMKLEKSSIASDVQIKNNDTIINDKDKQITLITSENKRLAQANEAYLDKLTNEQTNSFKYSKEVQEITNRLKESQNEVSQLNKDLHNYQREVDKLHDSQKYVDQQYNAKIQEVNTIASKNKKAVEKEKLSTLEEIEQLKKDAYSAEIHVKNSHEKVEELKQTIEDLKADNSILQLDYNRIQVSQNALHQEIDYLKSVKSDNELELEKFQLENSTYCSEYEIIKRELSDLKNKFEISTNEIKLLKNVKINLENVLEKLESERNDIQLNLDKAFETITALRGDLKESRHTRESLDQLVLELKENDFKLDKQITILQNEKSCALADAHQFKQLWEAEIKSRSQIGLELLNMEKDKNQSKSFIESNKRDTDLMRQTNLNLEDAKICMQENIKSLENEKKILLGEVKSCKKRLKDFELRENRFPDIKAELDKERISYEKIIESQKDKLNKAKENIILLNSENSNLKKEISDLQIDLDIVQKSRDVCKIANNNLIKFQNKYKSKNERLEKVVVNYKQNYISKNEAYLMKKNVEMKRQRELNVKLHELNQQLSNYSDINIATDDFKMKHDYRKSEPLGDKCAKLESEIKLLQSVNFDDIKGHNVNNLSMNDAILRNFNTRAAKVSSSLNFIGDGHFSLHSTPLMQPDHTLYNNLSDSNQNSINFPQRSTRFNDLLEEQDFKTELDNAFSLQHDKVNGNLTSFESKISYPTDPYISSIVHNYRV